MRYKQANILNSSKFPCSTKLWLKWQWAEGHTLVVLTEVKKTPSDLWDGLAHRQHHRSTDNVCSVLVRYWEVLTKKVKVMTTFKAKQAVKEHKTEIHGKENTELGHPTDSSCNLLINVVESFTQASRSYLTVSQLKVNIWACKDAIWLREGKKATALINSIWSRIIKCTQIQNLHDSCLRSDFKHPNYTFPATTCRTLVPFIGVG